MHEKLRKLTLNGQFQTAGPSEIWRGDNLADQLAQRFFNKEVPG